VTEKPRPEETFRTLKGEIRKRLLKYTRSAFSMLPRLEKPRILDIGCGSGIPTLELATLGQGEVVGIDIDRAALDELAGKIKKAGLSSRVKVVPSSLREMDFADGSFDILWSEGSIHAIGFERGLREWKRLLKPGGFMVVHDEQGDVGKKLKTISGCGYELLGHFTLSQEVWRTEYFAPLEKLVAESRAGDPRDPKLLEELRRAQGELDFFKKAPRRNSSAYFIIQKTDFSAQAETRRGGPSSGIPKRRTSSQRKGR